MVETLSFRPATKRAVADVCCRGHITTMSSQFEGLSHALLQETLLSKLNEQANLKSESRHLRDRLSTIRSALAAVKHEISQIEHFLSLPNVLGFPMSKATAEPELKRKIGRWGKVTYEPVLPPAAISPQISLQPQQENSQAVPLAQVVGLDSPVLQTKTGRKGGYRRPTSRPVRRVGRLVML